MKSHKPGWLLEAQRRTEEGRISRKVIAEYSKREAFKKTENAFVISRFDIVEKIKPSVKKALMIVDYFIRLTAMKTANASKRVAIASTRLVSFFMLIMISMKQ